MLDTKPFRLYHSVFTTDDCSNFETKMCFVTNEHTKIIKLAKQDSQKDKLMVKEKIETSSQAFKAYVLF